MADPRSILDALQAVKVAMDIAKALRGADVAFEKAELKLRIAELAEALSDARLAILDAQTEVRSLQQRIAHLEQVPDIRDRLVHRDNVYFLRDGDTERGPYCPRCFETDHKTMPLAALPPGFRDLARYTCPQCKATY